MTITHAVLVATRDVAALLPFYCDGLDFLVLGAFKDQEGSDGVMLGARQASYRLEHSPGHGEQLVFHLSNRREWTSAMQRMRRAGFEPVEAFEGPHERATFQDPHGGRVVLQFARSEPEISYLDVGPSRPEVEISQEHDGSLLGGRMRGESGDVLAGFAAHTRDGWCVVTHLWVVAAQRGRGFGRALLEAVEAAAVRRGCEQVVLPSQGFQSPAFCARMGYRKQGVLYAKRVNGFLLNDDAAARPPGPMKHSS